MSEPYDNPYRAEAQAPVPGDRVALLGILGMTLFVAGISGGIVAKILGADTVAYYAAFASLAGVPLAFIAEVRRKQQP
jgi:hypothetical protein